MIITGDKWFKFLHLFHINYFAMPCAGSVVLTQTHPAAPYVCRTGNITLRCQYDGVENVFAVLWVIGGQTTTNPSTIPGHTALPRTTTYQEVVVDSYTNLTEKYRCDLLLSNGTGLLSNEYDPMSECEHEVKLQSIHTAVCMKLYLCPRFTQEYNLCFYSC